MEYTQIFAPMVVFLLLLICCSESVRSQKDNNKKFPPDGRDRGGFLFYNQLWLKAHIMIARGATCSSNVAHTVT